MVSSDNTAKTRTWDNQDNEGIKNRIQLTIAAVTPIQIK